MQRNCERKCGSSLQRLRRRRLQEEPHNCKSNSTISKRNTAEVANALADGALTRPQPDFVSVYLHRFLQLENPFVVVGGGFPAFRRISFQFRCIVFCSCEVLVSDVRGGVGDFSWSSFPFVFAILRILSALLAGALETSAVCRFNALHRLL